MATSSEKITLVQFYASAKDQFRRLHEGELDEIILLDDKSQEVLILAAYDKLGNILAHEVISELKKHNDEKHYDIGYEIDQLYTFIDTNSSDKTSTNSFVEGVKEMMTSMCGSSSDILLLSTVRDEPEFVFIKNKAYSTYKKKIIQRHVKLVHEKLNHVKSLTQAQESLLKVASRLSVFDKLNDAQIVKITKDTRFIHYNDNELIFNQGDSGVEMYYIIKGEISVSVLNKDGKTYHEVAQLKAGSLLGEMAFIMKQNRTARAVAKGDLMVLSFSFNTIFQDDAALIQFYQNLVSILSHKLIDTNEKLTKLM